MGLSYGAGWAACTVWPPADTYPHPTGVMFSWADHLRALLAILLVQGRRSRAQGKRHPWGCG